MAEICLAALEGRRWALQNVVEWLPWRMELVALKLEEDGYLVGGWEGFLWLMEGVAPWWDEVDLERWLGQLMEDPMDLSPSLSRRTLAQHKWK